MAINQNLHDQVRAVQNHSDSNLPALSTPYQGKKQVITSQGFQATTIALPSQELQSIALV